MAATSGWCAGENLAAISDLHGSADYTCAMEKGMGDVERDRRIDLEAPVNGSF